MRNHLAFYFVALSMFVFLPGCMAETTDEIGDPSPEAVAEQELDAQRLPPRLCFQPIVTGPCRAYFRRYAFNRGTGRCEQFVYGGCQGNSNNFETMGGCQRTCGRFFRGPFR